jgi:hypothetical protein
MAGLPFLLPQRFVAADGDRDFRNRFKVRCLPAVSAEHPSADFINFWWFVFAAQCIPRIMNLPDLKLGGILNSTLKTYNGKPFLTGPDCHAFLKVWVSNSLRDCHALHCNTMFALRSSFAGPQLLGG